MRPGTQTQLRRDELRYPLRRPPNIGIAGDVAAAASLWATLGTGGNEARASRGNVTHERAARPVATLARTRARVASTRARRVVSAPLLRGRTERRRCQLASRARDDPRVVTERGAIGRRSDARGDQQRRAAAAQGGRTDRWIDRRPRGDRRGTRGRTGRRSDGPRLRFREVGPEAAEAARRLPARGLPRHRLPGLRSVHPVAPRLLFNVLEVILRRVCSSRSGWAPPPALPLTAATKWVLKDGIGSLATLAAGSLGGQGATRIPSGGW